MTNEMEMVDLIERKMKETHKHNFVSIGTRTRLNAAANEVTIEDQVCSICNEKRSREIKEW